MVETIYSGKRAVSGIQRDWDIDIAGKHFQVKTHAKAVGNNNRWSAVNNEITERVDELIIVVFTFDYKLREFYKIPWEKAVKYIRIRGKKKPRPEINWSHVKNYKQNIDNLPRQDVIKLFK